MSVSFLDSLFGKKVEVVDEEAAPESQPAATNPDAPESNTGTSAPKLDSAPVHVTDDTFEDVVLSSSLPALVDFWAPWCGPCRMIAPIVENLAKDYDGRAVIAKMNTDENVQMAGQLGIMGIPTLILFKDGQEVDRVVGYAPRHVLEEKLATALN
jgi:thioredoxin 1